MYKLQRTNTVNSKRIFPEKELHDHSPNFHINVSVSDLCIPMIDLPILLQEICGPIAHRHMHRKWNWGRAISRKGIHKWDSLQCSSAFLYTRMLPYSIYITYSFIVCKKHYLSSNYLFLIFLNCFFSPSPSPPRNFSKPEPPALHLMLVLVNL